VACAPSSMRNIVGANNAPVPSSPLCAPSLLARLIILFLQYWNNRRARSDGEQDPEVPEMIRATTESSASPKFSCGGSDASDGYS
jgi:hypothetical protein